ncbi:hypothetical protein GLYMA_13G081050v4 [Glycine max]|nr:hypothetical protein GLYMA_13G081050v4 [Glycine max]KAH1100369.1 hypothetical protein GYH30_035504 [Glycine max]
MRHTFLHILLLIPRDLFIFFHPIKGIECWHVSICLKSNRCRENSRDKSCMNVYKIKGPEKLASFLYSFRLIYMFHSYVSLIMSSHYK